MAIGVAVAAVLLGVVIVAARSGGRHHPSPAASVRHARARQAALAVGAASAASSYLGLDRARLRANVLMGRSLAQIADSTPGRSAAGLIDAMVAAKAARIARAAASGRVSKTREQARVANIRRRTTAEVLLAGGELSAAAIYLGATAVRIGGELQAGKTLAQIAAAMPGRTAAGLIDRLQKAEQKRLAAEQLAGNITHAQAAALAAALHPTLTAVVDKQLSLQG